MSKATSTPDWIRPPPPPIRQKRYGRVRKAHPRLEILENRSESQEVAASNKNEDKENEPQDSAPCASETFPESRHAGHREKIDNRKHKPLIKLPKARNREDAPDKKNTAASSIPKMNPNVLAVDTAISTSAKFIFPQSKLPLVSTGVHASKPLPLDQRDKNRPSRILLEFPLKNELLSRAPTCKANLYGIASPTAATTPRPFLTPRQRRSLIQTKIGAKITVFTDDCENENDNQLLPFALPRMPEKDSFTDENSVDMSLSFEANLRGRISVIDNTEWKEIDPDLSFRSNSAPVREGFAGGTRLLNMKSWDAEEFQAALEEDLQDDVLLETRSLDEESVRDSNGGQTPKPFSPTVISKDKENIHASHNVQSAPTSSFSMDDVTDSEIERPLTRNSCKRMEVEDTPSFLSAHQEISKLLARRKPAWRGKKLSGLRTDEEITRHGQGVQKTRRRQRFPAPALSTIYEERELVIEGGENMEPPVIEDDAEDSQVGEFAHLGIGDSSRLFKPLIKRNGITIGKVWVGRGHELIENLSSDDLGLQ